MNKLIITNCLHRGVVGEKVLYRLISLRPLKRREILLARRYGIHRYYLPSMTANESANFFGEFDKLWNQTVKPFDAGHPFWRNAVSSKMQEWERSSAYLSLILYTLSKMTDKGSESIIMVCSSLEEEDVCEKWVGNIGWEVERKYRYPMPQWTRRVLQEMRNVCHLFYMTSICIYKKWYSPKLRNVSIQKNKQVLITSLLYPGSINNGRYSDPFYGDLHEIIEKNGCSVTYLCNPLGDYRECVKKIREVEDASILVPYTMVRWSSVIILVAKLLVRRIRLSRVDFERCDFSRLIMWNARRFDYYFNFDAEIFYLAIKNISEKRSFDRLIQLYEGNVFERACVQAFRKYNSVLVVGYSHAVVFPLNLKVRMTEEEQGRRPEPDILVSTGSGTRPLMGKVGRRDLSRIYPSCALRSMPTIDCDNVMWKSSSNILVALDGVHGCVTVLDWILSLGEKLRGYTVKLRGHPNVPIGNMLHQCLYDMPTNYYISDSNLKEDIENSMCVIYRQTSVGMQALVNGVPAIHLDVDAPLVCDPIVDLKALKWTVSTEAQLLGALEEISKLKDDQVREASSVARAYVGKYFTVPDDNNVKIFYADYHDNH